MKSLFEPSVKEHIIDRINKLDESSSPRWGKMTVGQMCQHCGAVLNTYSQKTAMARPNLFVRLLIPWVRRTVLGSKPYQKNAATRSQWRQSEPIEFDLGKAYLSKALADYTDSTRRGEILAWDHPLFGPLTEEESGWAMYKHLDHHLQQFGV